MSAVQDHDVLNAVFAGTCGFPGEAFVDEHWFNVERREVFHHQWICVGFEHDAASPGDTCPVRVAGVPLVMVRDHDGRLRVFHNVCSHRGATLVEDAACGIRQLTCPYHRWIYRLDGRLQHTHHAGGFRVHITPEADPDQLGLVQVRSTVWNGFVFVDLSGTAGPFAEHIGPTEDRLAPVDFALLRHDPTFDTRLDVHANWKMIVENFVESYHVPSVHPELQRFNPMSAHFQILGGPAYAGQGGLAYGSSDNPKPMPGGSLPLMDSLMRQSFSYESLWVFPNLIVAPLPNATFAIILQPEAADRTTERVVFSFNGEPAMDAAQAQARREVAAAILHVNGEDVHIVESCQRGRRSPAFTGGVFMTNQESTSIHVQRMIAARLLEAGGHEPDLRTLPFTDIHHRP